jgi:hypothetical protein
MKVIPGSLSKASSLEVVALGLNMLVRFHHLSIPSVSMAMEQHPLDTIY